MSTWDQVEKVRDLVSVLDIQPDLPVNYVVHFTRWDGIRELGIHAYSRKRKFYLMTLLDGRLLEVPDLAVFKICKYSEEK